MCALKRRLPEEDTIMEDGMNQQPKQNEQAVTVDTVKDLDELKVFGSGNSSVGQLGKRDLIATTPFVIQPLLRISIAKIAAGSHHCLAISTGGEIYSWGSNDSGQLGREGRQFIPSQIDSLETFVIRDIGCGDDFSVALTDTGKVFAWGKNDKGQLGSGDRDVKNRPRPIKGVSSALVAIACGGKFVLALSALGELFGWGDNYDGQLGNGTIVPLEVAEMNEWVKKKAIPFIQIACGDSHALALTASGNVYSWGSNRFGQLGHGDHRSRTRPELIRTLARKQVTHIASGSNFSMAITARGHLFACGAGGSGQLGQGSENEDQIKAVPEVDSIVAVSCGRQHTIAIQKQNDKTRVLVCGANGSGQIGISDGSSPKHTLVPLVQLDSEQINTCYCGPDYSFFLHLPEISHTEIKQGLPILSFNIVTELVISNNYNQLQKLVETVFQSSACLNASFLDSWDKYKTSQEISGLNYEDITNTYDLLLKLPTTIINSCGAATARIATSMSKFKPSEVECVRYVLILLLNPLLSQPSLNSVVIEKICTFIIGLSANCKSALQFWIGSLPTKLLTKIVESIQQFLTYCYSTKYTPDSPIISCILVLDLIYTGIKNEDLPKINVNNKAISTHLSAHDIMMAEYDRLISSSANVFSFLHYPFLLTPSCKAKLINIAAEKRMQASIRGAVMEALNTGILAPYFVVDVRRDHLIGDALQAISSQHQALQRPMKVIFRGEEAVDEGGVKKEFFHLITKELFDVKYGMYILLPETRQYWFNQHSFDNQSDFYLVGLLFGLAIFNNVNLSVPLPRVAYKKLLKMPLAFEDLQSIEPQLYKSLDALMKNSIEPDDLALTFQVSYEYFGEVKTHDLIQNGGSIPVTNTNKEKFVELYTKYKLNDSIATQFDEFAKGFFRLVGDVILAPKMFTPEELERVICGNPEINLIDLESCTHYVGYSAEHPVIKSFWSVIKQLSQEEQRKFLLFLSGSDRVPLSGLASLHFTIQRSGPDSDRIPAAHTCFNILDVPEYSSTQKLKEKLLIAINHIEGFGMK